jgi:hypothetical protein
MEGKLLAMGKPVTIAEVRTVLGTPRSEELVAAGTAANLAFLPVLIDPAKAGDRRLAFTLQVKGDNALWRIELRNGVILTEPAAVPLPDHIALSPSDLADFLLGLSPPALGTPLAALDAALDRSGFVFLPHSPAAGLGGPACEVHLLGEGSQ